MAKKINLDESGDLRKLVEEFQNIGSETELRRLNEEASDGELERSNVGKRSIPMPFVIGGVALAVALIAIVFVLVVNSSQQAHTVPVPDVIGKTEADARSIIGDGDLRATVMYDPSSQKTAGTVILQRPVSGRRVPAGEAIEITVAGLAPKAKPGSKTEASTPGQEQEATPAATEGENPTAAQEQVAVPDVEGMVDSKAKAKLEEVGLKVEMLTASDSSMPERVVIASNPGPQSTVAKGSTVQLTINSPAEEVAPAEVPEITIGNYAGMSSQEALNDLRAKGFAATWRTEASSEHQPGYVIRTEPAEGETVEAGQSVTIIVAK